MAVKLPSVVLTQTYDTHSSGQIANTGTAIPMNLRIKVIHSLQQLEARLVLTITSGAQGNPQPGTMLPTNCASQFRLFPTFLLSVPLLMVIWSYPEQSYNSATGHFVWLVRSPGTVSHCTFIPQLHCQHSKTCSRHIFSLVPTSLTDCFQEYEQQTLYDALVVILAM